ncbi:16S rRNA methyltransferase [Cuniculiplasma sp. SKW3]|uniref:16S rRNA methyltransferase n=1 Tax=Cuniculiplasma sp. SKW3 TaxID=3400170 RepID=UPI003FD2A81A
MLTLNIIDAELELVPESMWEDYQIRKVAKNLGKKYNEMLLDSNYMHGAIERHFPGMSNRMGRPDIFHTFLNVTQDSILNKKGELRINIHTKNDKIIRISPETRIPKSYNRFAGLFEKLLSKGNLVSPDGKTLISIEDGKFHRLLRGDGTDLLLSPKGRMAKIGDVIKSGNLNVIIGGFSEGDFISPIYDELDSVSIFEEELTIWTVGWEIISSYERTFGII